MQWYQTVADRPKASERMKADQWAVGVRWKYMRIVETRHQNESPGEELRVAKRVGAVGDLCLNLGGKPLPKKWFPIGFRNASEGKYVFFNRPRPDREGEGWVGKGGVREGWMARPASSVACLQKALAACCTTSDTTWEVPTAWNCMSSTTIEA